LTEQQTESPVQKTILEQMGGVWGMFYSAVPVMVFVLVNQFTGLMPAIWTSVGVALAVMLWRIVRKEPVRPAISGLLGVALFAGIAWWTGSARGFFLAGIWYNLAYGSVMLLSLLVRWPLVGVLWSLANGSGFEWRRHRAAVLRYDVATLCFVVLFAVRYVTQKWFYDANDVSALGVVKVVLGPPAFALTLLVVFWAVRSVKRIMAEKASVGRDDLAQGQIERSQAGTADVSWSAPVRDSSVSTTRSD
jgi:hypothetical protein